VREISLKTERKTQLLDITEEVQSALGAMNGASAALVYVPHTTAGVTINEDADPALAEDIESAMERIVDDNGGWRHSDADGPNAPSVAGRGFSSASSMGLGSGRSTSPRWRSGLAGEVARFLGRELQARGRDRPQVRLAALTRASVDSGAA